MQIYEFPPHPPPPLKLRRTGNPLPQGEREQEKGFVAIRIIRMH